jgi:hypothetical protein
VGRRGPQDIASDALLEEETRMTEELLDNCRRCGTALLGADRSHDDLCRQCRADPDRVAPPQDATDDAPPAWFLVRWEIDLEATSAEQAAQAALAIHRDPTSIATVFTVHPLDEPDADVELDLLERTEP